MEKLDESKAGLNRRDALKGMTAVSLALATGAYGAGRPHFLIAFQCDRARSDPTRKRALRHARLASHERRRRYERTCGTLAFPAY